MIHVAWGHYTIGEKGGVNTVIKRNVSHLLEMFDDYEITIFGSIKDDINTFMDFSHPRLSYIDMPELDTGHEFVGRDINAQDYHDYRWIGAQIEKEFIKKIEEFDLIIFENSTVANNPPVNVAFSLYTQGCLSYTPEKQFIFRAHDFFFDRPTNFSNIKKIRDHRNDYVPDWHQMIIPDYPNVHYLSINSEDAHKLYENGIRQEKIHYLPNSVKLSRKEEDDDRSDELRQRLEKKGLVQKGEKIIYYPIRIAPRKNVEESVLMTTVFNRLGEPDIDVRKKFRTEGNYRLIISLDTKTGKFKPYSDHIRKFVEENNLPVTLGVGDHVSLQRNYNEDGSIDTFGVTDMYKMSDIVITTSILEGFGMVFIEPWLEHRPLIGRNLFVTKDFREAGMKLGHLYDSLKVKGTDFPRYGMERDSIIYIASNEYHPEEVEKRLDFILELRNNNDVLKDFAEDNYLALNNTLSMLRASQNYLDHNMKIVSETYSNEAVAQKLDSIIREVTKK